MVDEPMQTGESDGGEGLEGLPETKKLSPEANMKRTSEAMSTGKVSDIYTEVNTLNEILSKELKQKDESIELLKLELEKAKQELLDKDASLSKSKEELGSMKSFESKALSLFAESEQRFQELDMEIENRKQSEKKMFDSFSQQTKELEQTKMQLIESKREIEALQLKLKTLEESSEEKSESRVDDRRELDQIHLQAIKKESPEEQIRLLKNELKLATEAEENSKKALDDLALALKEVATEANQLKQNLASEEEQLEQARQETEQCKLKLNAAREKCDELKKEAELYKNSSERLRLEAEDAVLAWSGKEAGFVACIRRAEDERDAAQKENANLAESLKAAEIALQTAKQENNNLRDILKQALNEASVAKEAARIATAENSQLKDALQEKQKALEFISKENENLKMNEAAAFDSIKELKRLVSQGALNKTEDTESSQEQLQPQNSVEKEHGEGKKRLISEFGFSIKELKLPFRYNSVEKDEGGEDHKKQSDDDDDDDCDSARIDPLKGSIFDTDSPVAARRLPSTHNRTNSSLDVSDGINSDDFDGDGTQFEDEGDKSYRKKKALLRRFGDLLMRRSYHRKEPSIDQKCAHNEPSN